MMFYRFLSEKNDFSAKMCAYLCCSTCTRESVGINLRQKMEKVCQNCPTFLKASWMKACIWEKKESDTPAPHCTLQVFQAVVEADQLRRSFSPEWMWKCKKIVSRQKIPGVSKKTLCSEAYVNVSFLHRKKKKSSMQDVNQEHVYLWRWLSGACVMRQVMKEGLKMKAKTWKCTSREHQNFT